MPAPSREPVAPGEPVEPGVAPDARRSLALLLAINLFNYIDRYVLAAILPLVALEFFGDAKEASGERMGLLGSAFMWSYTLFSPAFGWLGDRTRRWVLVGAGVILWSLASGASGLATTFWMLFMARALVGIGEAAYGPTAPTIISDLFPVRKRSAVLSWFYMAIPVGSALGFLLGGFVGHHWGWRWAFYVVVPPGILLGLLCFLRREPPRGAADVGGPTRRHLRLADLRVLLHTKSYLLNTAGMTAMTFALGALTYWMPTYISVERGAGELDHVNFVLGGVVAGAGLTGTLAGGYLGDALRWRFSGAYFLVSGLGLILGFPLFLATLWLPFPFAWVTMFLSVFCLMLSTGPSNAITANVCHPALRSTAFAVNIFVIHALGDALSPWLVGAIKDQAGTLEAGFLLVGGLILVGGVVWLSGMPHLAGDTALAPRRGDPAPGSREEQVESSGDGAPNNSV
ncbi:MAG: spinster family MFS transporter [Phycisphaerales bacterium]